MDSVKETIQLLALGVGMIAGLSAAFKTVHEIKENRKQKKREFLWKQSHLAHQIVEEFWTKPKVYHAIHMVTWKAMDYALEDGSSIHLKKSEVLKALRVDNLVFTEHERFVRLCFADLFHRLGRLEHFIKRDLITFEDVAFDFTEQVKRLKQDWGHYEKYMTQYNMNYGLAFIRRFDEHE